MVPIVQARLLSRLFLHMIERIEKTDPKTFDLLYVTFEQGFRKRAKYENFPLCDDIKFPRLPRKDRAIKELKRLAENGEILLGNTVQPKTITTVDPITSEHVEIEVHSRKIEFSDLREFTLKRHLKYLRAPNTEYENLDKENILSMLEDYGALDETHASLPETELRNIIRKLETTRLIAIWYDHATIGKKSHVMFTFQIIYDKSTYICPPGMTERALQHEIETPQTYFIGLSSSTTEAERSFDEMRLGDILTLSEKLTINDITYHDKFRMTFGDNPVRCSEAGQNKSGHYRLCSLPLHIKNFSNFKELINAKHLTINEQRDMANRGGFFTEDIEKNQEINLQGINALKYCTTRKITFSDAADAEKKQKLDLLGRKSLPALLSKHPNVNLEDMFS